jgi:excisionase family DNA binding protein
MTTQNINLVHVSLEDMANTLREIVASELLKAGIFFKETPKDNSNKILTRDEVCKLLKVSNTTLHHWNNDKVLVNHKIGRRVYYMKADVMAKLNSQRIVS